MARSKEKILLRRITIKRLSTKKLAETVSQKRKEQGLSQQGVADLTNINRALISRIENDDFMPSFPQLEELASALDFDPTSLFIDEEKKNTQECEKVEIREPRKICVAGSGYVGLSLATLLSQHNQVSPLQHLFKNLRGGVKRSGDIHGLIVINHGNDVIGRVVVVFTEIT